MRPAAQQAAGTHAILRSPDSQSVLQAYARVRARTEALAAPLSAEDAGAQSMPDASPAKWHLAHVTWFFETFVLERRQRGFRPFHPAFRILFNSYYVQVGERHHRPQRGLLTRPSLADVLDYRRDVDERMHDLFLQGVDEELMRLVTLGLQHEEQHQELLLTDVLHLFSCNPLRPAYDVAWRVPQAQGEVGWLEQGASLCEIGQGIGQEMGGGEDGGFCFDNETPRHRVWLEPHALAHALVSNAEYLEFIEAGGYREPGLWLSEGWDWVQAQDASAPLHWHRDETGWQEFGLAGLQALDPRAPVAHVSYYEADAYARFRGVRLPTEAEWENALRAVRSGRPALRDAFGLRWQWTSSSYSAYPGYRPAEGAIGEYNGKFMVNQYVLRGSSCATPAGHARASYRNFFPAAARWQFSGIRLARSL